MNLLLLSFTSLIVLALKVELKSALKWETKGDYICVYDEIDTETQTTSCLFTNKTWVFSLSCERDINDKNCGNNGCISASFELKNISKNPEDLSYLKIYSVKYTVKVNKDEEEQKKIKNRKTEVQNILKDNSSQIVSLNLNKEALLKIKSVSYFYEYTIFVDPSVNISTDDPEYSYFEKLKDILYCKIIFEEPEEEIITFHLEIIIIAFILIFYVVIILMAWKCKDTHHDKPIFVTKPIIQTEHKNETPKRTKIEIQHVDDNDQKIEVIVENPILISKQKKVVQPTVMFDDHDDEENMRRYSLNKRRPTGFVAPRQNIKQSAPTDIKKIQDEVKKNLRRKSVQFNKKLVDVRKMSSRMPDTDTDDDTHSTDFTPDQEVIIQKELQIRRKSMLLGPEFFKDIPKTKAPKNGTSDTAEEAARKAIANKARRASAAYAVHKAKSLNVSDDSD